MSELEALLAPLESSMPAEDASSEALLAWLEDRRSAVDRLSAFRLDTLPPGDRDALRSRLEKVLALDHERARELGARLEKASASLRELPRARDATRRYASATEALEPTHRRSL